MVSSPPVLNYTNREFTTTSEEVLDFIAATRPDDQTDFQATSLGSMIVDLVAWLVDKTSYAQDITAQEIYLATLRRYDSALRWARSVGYVPRSARSATVSVVSETLPANIVSFGGVIAARSFLTGANDRRYEVTEDVTIVPGSANITLSLKEGQTFTDVFTPRQTSKQEFVTSQGIVEDNSWTVFVGDDENPLNEWTQVDNIDFELSATNTYEVFFDGLGRLHILFGDGSAGAIPDQAITVTYRITNGTAGDAQAGTIRGSLQASVVGSSTVASINVNNNASAAAGGLDRESVAELKVSIPNFIRTQDKTTTITDYDQAVATQFGALSFSDIVQAGFNGNIVRVHVWDRTNFTFVSTSPTQGTTSVVAYRRYAQAPTARIFEVQSYLRSRNVATVHTVVVLPTVAQVDLEFGNIRYDPLNNLADVHEGVVEAIVGVFESSSGFRIRMSELTKAVGNVPGVVGSQLERVLFEHVDFDDPSLPDVTDDFRRDQDSSGSSGGPFDPLQDLDIPGAAERVFYDDAFLFDNQVEFAGAVDSTVVQAINLRSLTFELIAV